MWELNEDENKIPCPDCEGSGDGCIDPGCCTCTRCEGRAYI